MYSFYGGRPGNSFIIITSFDSIQDMIEKFKKGPNYTDVHFDEYVIINTINKNDSDNGKIFRRGYNYTDSQGGAIPVGQIVGPSGPAPSLILSDYNTVKNKKEDPTINPNQIDKKIGSYKISDSSLVPGYEYNESTGTKTFNDEIQWISCSIRTPDDGTCEAQIGFKIPYLVMDWQAESISSYSEPTIEQVEKSIGHPFYKKWKLGIPKGKQGTSLSNLQIKKYNANDDEDLKTFDGQDYIGVENNNIIIYNQTSYENETPTITRKYLGDYNIIKEIKHENGKLLIQCSNDNDDYQEFSINQIESVDLNENGQFIIKYFNNENPTVFPLQWVKDVTFNQSNGTLTFEYANSETQSKICPINWIQNAEIKQVDSSDTRQFLYLNWVNPVKIGNSEEETKTIPLTDFKWVKKLNLTEQGILQATYNNNDVQDLNTKNNAINWVESIRIDPETGALQCVTNNGATYNISTENGLKWITSTQLNEDGVLTINYNAGSPDILEQNPIKWIESISLSQDGILTINYNTGDSQIMTKSIRWIEGISMNNRTGEITATYNNSPSSVSIGQVRFINNIEVNEDNNHLMITYSDDLENSVDVGSVAANLTFIDEYAYGLSCSGLGSIVVTTEENQGVEQTKKYINLTSSTTSLIGDRNIQILSPREGEEDTLNLTAFIKGSNQQISFGNNRPAISVERLLTGLNFIIEIPSSENPNIYENLSNGDIVDVLITGLNLHFTEQ